MAGLDGVRSVEVNRLTGSVLVLHDLDWGAARFTSLLREILIDLSRRPSRQSAAGVAVIGSRAERGHTTAAGRSSHARGSGLLRLLLDHKNLALRSLGITLIDRLFEASPPALIGLAVDSVSRPSRSALSRLGSQSLSSQLGLLVAAGGVAWTADSAVGYFRAVASADLGNAVRTQLRNELYRHFQTLDLAQIEAEPPAYWESIFQGDANAIARYFQEDIDPLVSIVANSIIVFWQLLKTSFGLALLQLIVVPGLYFISKGMLPEMQSRRKLANKAKGNLNNLLLGNVQGISTIASFAREADEAEKIAAAGREAASLKRNADKVGAAYVPLLQMAVGAGFLGTLGFGGLLVNRGRIVAGQLSMLGYSSLRLLQALGYLGVSIDNLQQVRLAMSRVEQFRERTSKIQSGPDRLPASSVRGEFKVEQVTFGYPNEPPLFHNFSISFPAGKTIGIVGQSGAGKSTLLKLLLRYYDVDFGAISLDGKPIRSLNLQDLRRAVAYVPQQPFIFPGTVRENIAYSRPLASDEEVARAAAVANADRFIQDLPQGYETVVHGIGTGGQGQALSGGQAQRLAIARAALANTPVLLFDEATSALDNETESAIQESLLSFSATRTTVIVAHRLSMVRRADYIYVMDHGGIREEGTHDELIRQGGIYANFWRIQTGEPPKTQSDYKAEGSATVAGFAGEAPRIVPHDASAAAAAGDPVLVEAGIQPQELDSAEAANPEREAHPEQSGHVEEMAAAVESRDVSELLDDSGPAENIVSSSDATAQPTARKPSRPLRSKRRPTDSSVSKHKNE